MGLSIEDVARSTERLTALFNASPEQKASYCRSILEACGWMLPQRFEEVCVALLREVSRGSKPVPKMFIAIYNKIAQERGWNHGVKAHVCEGCGGFGYVYCRLKNLKSGEEYDAMKPCLVCRKVPPRDLNEDTVEVERVVETLEDRWAKLTDKGKAGALRYGEGLAELLGKPEYLERFIQKFH